jgi:putative sigma-54 modulation protein
VKNTSKSLKKAVRAASPVRAKKKPTTSKEKRSSNTSGDSTMKLILSTHNLTLTDAIETHIVSRIEQLGHLEPRAINARVVIEHDHAKVTERQFKCSIRVTEPGPDLFAEDAETDLYAAIDLVAKKIEQQIRKRHNKFKARNHSEASKSKRSRQEKAL